MISWKLPDKFPKASIQEPFVGPFRFYIPDILTEQKLFGKTSGQSNMQAQPDAAHGRSDVPLSANSIGCFKCDRLKTGLVEIASSRKAAGPPP